MPSNSTIFDRQAIFSQARSEGGLDQDSVVRQMRQQAPSKIKVTKRKIPMGKLIPELLTTEEDLADAVYTWLRSAVEWDDLTICFAEDPDVFRLKKEMATRFADPDNDTPYWKRSNDGMWALRTVIAKIMIRYDNVVKVQITKRGVEVFTDADAKFGPYRQATAADVAAFNDELDRILTKREAEAVSEGRTWVAPDAPRLSVKDVVDNEAFQPYVEWTKTKRGMGIQD